MRGKQVQQNLAKRPVQISPWASALGALAAGLALGLWLSPAAHSAQSAVDADAKPELPLLIRSVAVRAPSNGLTRPLLLCNEPAEGDGELASVRASLQREIDAAKATGRASHVSVHLRDLDRGRWFEIEEDTQYRPASLLKVPLLIAWLQQAEREPGLLERQLQWNPAPDLQLHEDPAMPGALEIGKSYKVKELLDKMIIWSRNDAKFLLAAYIDPHKVDETYVALGVPPIYPNPDQPGQSEEITLNVGQMGRFFRLLYNASWLDRVHSDLALEMMSHAEFHDGLTAGLPPGTKFSHKFGIRIARASDDKPAPPSEAEQLHDCGIVYAPNRPYLLCVMTKGKDHPGLVKVLKHVSAAAWTAMSAGK